MSSNRSVTSASSSNREIKSSSTQQQQSSTTTAQRTQVSKTTGSETIEKSSQQLGGNASVTTTTTIYDADGNVVKTITNVDDKYVPESKNRSIEYHSTSNDNRSTSAAREALQDNQKYNKSDIQQEYDRRSSSPVPSQADSVATTYYVDENYVDTKKMRNKDISSNSNNFYGHGVDSCKTVVGNTYDSNAVQNTIGTRGRVIMDHNIDTTDVVFSNDRNYGKTGWNGKFIDEDEEPQVRKTETKKQNAPKSWDTPCSLKNRTRLRPEDLPPAGMPSDEM